MPAEGRTLVTADGDWYWGVVIRVDAADDPLRTLGRLDLPPGIELQRPGTGHVTLLYAPRRDARGERRLADAAAPIAAATAPFSVRIAGFGEFHTPERVVAWLGLADDAPIQALRRSLFHCDDDVLVHPFVPHCTLAYGDAPDAYLAERARIEAAMREVSFDVAVDEVWIAGFPRGGHPARDLVYRARLPLDG